MKAFLRIAVSLVLISMIRPVPADAIKIPFTRNVGVLGSWNSPNGVQNRFHFRLPNGDIAIAKVLILGPKKIKTLGFQIIRQGERDRGSTLATEIKNPVQVAGSATQVRNSDESIQNLLKPVALSTTNRSISVLMFRGDEGIVVLGQINDVVPSAYFTTFIPNDKDANGNFIARPLPLATLAYAIKPETGKAFGLRDAADIGLIFSFEDGTKVTKLLSTPFPRPGHMGIAQAKERAATPDDKRFTDIAIKEGLFDVPSNLRDLVTVAVADHTDEKDLRGVDLLKSQHRLEDSLKASLKLTIFGQDEAINRLVTNYGESLTNKTSKPRVLVLMGPSGVGKTYIGQEFAQAVYGSSEKFLEIAGSEYGAHLGALDAHKLFGTAAGILGAQKGLLPEWLEKTGGDGVILINEGDKMHREVWLRLMEFLDQGKMGDGNGRALKGKSTTIMITTNRGATRMFPPAVSGWSQADIDKQLQSFSQDTLKGFYIAKDGLADDKSLPREILNRIDEYIPFGPLSKEAAISIANRRVFELNQDYERKYLITVKIDPSAVDQIALSGWSAADDARQIRRAVGTTMKSALDIGIKKLNLKNGQTLAVTYDNSDIRNPGYRVTVGDHSEMIGGRVLISNNPLKNKNLSDVLTTLEEKLNEQVIGQKYVLANVAAATISHAMRPEKSRPLVLGLLGVSGNGKTETGRALAKIRYGGHISIISMGEVATMQDFDKKFGSAAQYQGGDIPRDFEVALRNNPGGGVIVFDEISDMGGRDPAMRAALLLKLNNIFEEGVWTSPIDNKVYQLDKYTFVLSGNESEQLFANVSSDDNLMSIWEANRDPAKVREMLSNAKFPSSLINRVNWSLMKPLLSYEVHDVTKKLWNREAEAFEKENPGLKVSVTENFFDNVTTAYFSPDQGGRAIRAIFENRIGQLLFDVLTGAKAHLDTTDLRGVEVVIGLEDNHLKTPYLTPTSPARKVAFVAAVKKNGHVVHTTEIDATSVATEQVLLGKEAAMSVSIHEMGHAVANVEEVTGERFAYVTIRGGKMGDLRYYGYARYVPIEGSMLNPDHDRTVMKIAQLWAGAKAQELAGYKLDAGWSNDLEKIRKYATAYLTKWGLDRDLVGLPVDKNGEVMMNAISPEKGALFSRRMDELMAEGEAMAEKLVRAHWSLVGAGANELMKHGEISGPRLAEIRAKVEKDTAAGIAIPHPHPLPPRTPLTCESFFL